MRRAAKDTVRELHREPGFALIELLVVIVIIAVLTAIAVPQYLSQRQHAEDTACFSLVREALTVVQGALADNGAYDKINVAMLNAGEPDIKFIAAGGDIVTTNPPSISSAVVADSTEREVLYYPESTSVMDIASRSESGDWFGVQVDTKNLLQTGYVKVKVVDGSAALGW